MSRFKVIQYKGVEIAYSDYSELKKTEEIEEVFNQSVVFVKGKPKGSVLSMINLTGTFFNNEITKKLSEASKETEQYTKSTAVVGVSGLGKIVLSGVSKITGRKMPTSSNEEEAKEYLASL